MKLSFVRSVQAKNSSNSGTKRKMTPGRTVNRVITNLRWLISTLIISIMKARLLMTGYMNTSMNTGTGDS